MSLIIPAQLFEEPGDWIRWVAKLMERREKPMERIPKPNTVSGRLIVSRAPAWAQGIALSEALSGKLETLAAREVCERFEAGEPLDLLPFGSMEMFRTFTPQLTFLGGDEYRVNDRAGQVFTATDHAAALKKARVWFLSIREQEIQEARKQSLELGGKAGLLVRDLLNALIRRDKESVDRDGRRLVWENGAHGMYAVSGNGFCYGLEVSSSVAGQFALLAMQSWGSKPPVLPDEEKVSLLAPTGWRRSNGGFEWENGRLDDSDVIFVADTPTGRLVFKRGQMVVKGKAKTLLTAKIGGHPEEVAKAWAVSQVIRKVRRL